MLLSVFSDRVENMHQISDFKVKVNNEIALKITFAIIFNQYQS